MLSGIQQLSGFLATQDVPVIQAVQLHQHLVSPTVIVLNLIHSTST